MGSIDHKTGDWEAVFEMSKVKVMNTSGKHVQLGGGLSLKPGACVEAHPQSPLAEAVAAANKEAWATVPGVDDAPGAKTGGIPAGEVHVTHSTKPAEGKTWVGVDLAKGPSKSAYGVKNNNPHPVTIDGHVFQPGEIVPASLIEKNAGVFVTALQQQPGLKPMAGYFTGPEVWKKSMPTIDFAAAEAKLASAMKEGSLTQHEELLQTLVTNHGHDTLKVPNPPKGDVTIKTGQSVVIKTNAALREFLEHNGCSVTVQKFADDPGQEAPPSYHPYGPGVPVAAAKNMLKKFSANYEAVKHKAAEAKAAGMKLVTIADVEEYLTLRGYADFCVVEAEGTVMVEVRGMLDQFAEQLRADIRVRLPVTVDVMVIAAPEGE